DSGCQSPARESAGYKKCSCDYDGQSFTVENTEDGQGCAGTGEGCRQNRQAGQDVDHEHLEVDLVGQEDHVDDRRYADHRVDTGSAEVEAEYESFGKGRIAPAGGHRPDDCGS